MGEYGDLDLADELMALRAENARLRDQLDYFGNLAREHMDELETEIARLREALKEIAEAKPDAEGLELRPEWLQSIARAAMGESDE